MKQFLHGTQKAIIATKPMVLAERIVLGGRPYVVIGPHAATTEIIDGKAVTGEIRAKFGKCLYLDETHVKGLIEALGLLFETGADDQDLTANQVNEVLAELSLQEWAEEPATV